MKKCSRCRRVLANLKFRLNNKTCRKCCRQVTIWNINNKTRYNINKSKSYHKNKEKTLTALRQKRNKEKWKVSYHLAKQRCNNPKNPAYKHYGGRGIQFQMTLKDFEYLWKRDKAHLMRIPTIDRKDNDGNYELTNCRFIEKSQNTIKRNYERARIC